MSAYAIWRESIKARAAQFTGPLFTPTTTGLNDLYLANLPEEDRQHHTCNSCRKFLERYGGLVTLSADGSVESPFWHVETTPKIYQPAVKAMLRAIKVSKVTGIFYSTDRVFGTPITGDWTHFSAPNTRIFAGRLETPYQAMAQKGQDYLTLRQALVNYGGDPLQKATALLRGGTLSRSAAVLKAAVWLQETSELQSGLSQRYLANAIWFRVATAPAGYCTPGSGMLGALLDDIKAGLDAGTIARKFNQKMAPDQYQRPQAAPKAGAIDEAEKIFARLGLAPALDRRHASLADLPTEAFIWKPATAKPGKRGLFSGLRAPAPTTALASGAITTMTWAKFARTVLSQADSVQLQVPESADRFMALVAAADPLAPPILRWDHTERRNAFSWYYASGADAEMRRRLDRSGGAHQGMAIRFSLLWNNYNDLDLHALSPGNHIYYGSKRGRDGGWLDVDMNVGGASRDPVENIRWATGASGGYSCYVNLYRTHRCPIETPFRAEVQIDNQVFVYDGVTRYENPGNNFDRMIKVIEFAYGPHGARVSSGGKATPATANATAWGVTPRQFVDVLSVVKSPNTWHAEADEQHAFLILAGCADNNPGIGRGFFPEMLHGDLRPVRAVLEAYNASAEIQKITAPAAGYGISSNGAGDAVIAVTSAGVRALYKIDRWD